MLEEKKTLLQPYLARWFYPIHPNLAWFEDFARLLSSPDVRIWAEESESVPELYGWESRHLNDVTSTQDLFDRSAALKALFDGAMFLWLGTSYVPLTFKEAKAHAQADEPFVRRLPDSADVRVEPFSQAEINGSVYESEWPLGHPVSKSLFAARYDDIVREILKYIGVQGLTYVTLYALYDWMKQRETGWTQQKIASVAGWTTSRLNDFTATANNPAYLGPFCRHGGVATPPKRPMPLDEAIAPILGATQAFIDERANSLNLQAKWEALPKRSILGEESCQLR